MMLPIKLLMPVMGGLAAHAVTKPTIDRLFSLPSTPYKNLTQYGVGFLLIQPFAVLLDNHLDIEDAAERHVLADLLAGVLFGIGVMTGYLIDAVGKE